MIRRISEDELAKALATGCSSIRTRAAEGVDQTFSQVRAWADDAGCGRVYGLTQESSAVARALCDRVATSTGFVHYEIPTRGE